MGNANIALPPPINISTVSDANCVNASASISVNSDSSGKPLSNVKNESTSSETGCDGAEKSKDQITNEIALKVSTLLSNPTVLQSAISQMQCNTTEKSDNQNDSLQSPGQKESDVTDAPHKENGDEGKSSVTEAQLETVR